MGCLINKALAGPHYIEGFTSNITCTQAESILRKETKGNLIVLLGSQFVLVSTVTIQKSAILN